MCQNPDAEEDIGSDYRRLKTILFGISYDTSQELQMLFSVTPNCQVTMIVINFKQVVTGFGDVGGYSDGDL